MQTSRYGVFAAASALLLVTACAGNRNPPIKASITTTPPGATAQLKCREASEHAGVTPITFHVPLNVTPCTLRLAKSGFVTKQETVTAAMLLRRNASSYDPLRRAPVRTLEPGTSVLGAFLRLLADGILWLGGAIARAVDRPTDVVDPQLHFNLQPE